MSGFRSPLFSSAAAFFILLSFSAAPCSFAAEIKDSESATHGDDAARYQVVDTYEFPGFKVIQVNLPVLSHYSYLLVSGKETLVIDPGLGGFLASLGASHEYYSNLN